MRLTAIILIAAMIIIATFSYLRSTKQAVRDATGAVAGDSSGLVESARKSVQQINEATEKTNESVKKLIGE